VAITVKQHTSINIDLLKKDIKDLDVLLDNLVRLRLIKEDNPFGVDIQNVVVTSLGFRFMIACTFH
jgi:hypothetical protein